jgi:uncharacterized integral membrane protein
VAKNQWGKKHRSNNDKANNDGFNDKKDTSGLSPKQVGWVVLAVIAALFVVLNSDKSKISFIAFSANLPLWVLVVVSLILGFLIGKLSGSRRKDDE